MFNLVVFLDLKKPFCTVNHEILLRKLELHGITGEAMTLMWSYITVVSCETILHVEFLRALF